MAIDKDKSKAEQTTVEEQKETSSTKVEQTTVEEQKETSSTKVEQATIEEQKETSSTKVEQATIEEQKDNKADEIFKSYKDCNKLYKTTDGLYFFEKNDAKNNALQLKDKTINEITR